jgi:hypothetical protein
MRKGAQMKNRTFKEEIKKTTMTFMTTPKCSSNNKQMLLTKLRLEREKLKEIWG